MAKSFRTKYRFVVLRAQGWSFNRIAKELKVCKPVLIDWARQFTNQINNFRYFDYQALLELHQMNTHCIVDFTAKELQKLFIELSKRNPSELSMKELLALCSHHLAVLNQETSSIKYITADDKRFSLD